MHVRGFLRRHANFSPFPEKMTILLNAIVIDSVPAFLPHTMCGIILNHTVHYHLVGSLAVLTDFYDDNQVKHSWAALLKNPQNIAVRFLGHLYDVPEFTSILRETGWTGDMPCCCRSPCHASRSSLINSYITNFKFHNFHYVCHKSLRLSLPPDAMSKIDGKSATLNDCASHTRQGHIICSA